MRVPDYRLIGHNYQTPDLVAKVTGRAKYAEDYRVEGMLFCKLLLSPVPHARVRGIDTRAALALPGVRAILTAADLPPGEAPKTRSETGQPVETPAAEVAITNEPLYEGEPILAVAADSEALAAEAVEAIRLDLDLLPFVIDPFDGLRPGGPAARAQGNVFIGQELKTLRWTGADFAQIAQGRFPMNAQHGEIQSLGDVDAQLRAADLVLDETLYQQSTAHAPLESRTALAYWRNGRLFLHGSTQSVAQTVASVARWVGVDPKDVAVISEYCGGGFGSKIPGAQSMAIPALLSKKAGRPVMMRISREEETYIGRVRPGFQAGARIGFRKDGRIMALDLFIVEDSGPYQRQGDHQMAATVSSLLYQPMTVRFRGISVATNTPPRVSQRAPGGLQAMAMLEPLISKAARTLGIDQVQLRKINAPQTGSAFGLSEAPDRPRPTVTSAFAREALDKGAALFGWDERKARATQRNGTKVTGVSAALSTFMAGSIGFDGLLIIKPDGKLYVHQGVGNLGTHSVIDTARVAAEFLTMPWEKCEVVWGDTGQHVPWSSRQSGSQTTHAHSRANYAAAMDARRKLQEIAARDLGGQPEDYVIVNERVHHKGSPARGLSFAAAAARAVELAGKFDGHELPATINPMTKASATALAGQGLMGVAKDELPRKGLTYAFVAAFAEVEVDIETGVWRILEYVGVADVGTVLHPRSLGGQIHGGAIQGMGHARSQKLIYDKQYGVALANRFHQNRPPTILDVPVQLKWDAVNMPDPQNPVGAKGIGEAAIGAGAAAVLCAINDAIGDDLLRRTPVQPDMILIAVEAHRRVHDTLSAYI
jgi:CO/xanthine dehydrogenase Mo-binding subunit